ncbi:MAG: hypothetical protein ACRDPM_10250 [Solirubrobacteraceae bacterium]
MRAPVHTRRRLSAALACIGAIAVLAGVPLTYAGQVLGDSTQFSARATGLLDNPSIRSLIEQRVRAQAIQSANVPAQYVPLVTKAVDIAVRTPAFHRTFDTAIADLHRSVFVSDANTITLRLAHVGKLVLDALRRVSPGLAAQVPPSLSRQVIRISGGDLGQAARAARAVERAHTEGVLLLVAGAIVFLIAIAQAGERRRAAGYVGLAILMDGVLLVAAYTLIRPVVLSRFAVGQDRSAAGAVWNAFLSGLRSDAVILAAAGAVVAALMAAASAVGGGRRERARPEPRRSRPVR